MSAFEQSVLAALGRIEKKLGSAGATAEATGDSRAPLAVDFEASIINGPAAALFAAAESVPGDDGKKLAASLRAQFAFALRLIDMTAKCRKPTSEELPALYAQLKEADKPLAELAHPRTGTKDVDVSNAARGFEQGSSSFSWPLAPGAVEAVSQGLDSSGTFCFRASKAAKEAKKNELLATCNAYNGALKAMAEWVKENAKMGVIWNAKGVAPKDWSGVAGGAAAAPAAAAAAAPAPAPAAAAAAAPAAAPASSTAGGPVKPNLGALFSSISAIDQSSGKTAGLKHVTKDMKSSALAAAGVPPVVAPKAPAAAAAPRAAGGARGAIKMGDPRVALEGGNRWVVEFQTKEVLAAAGGGPLVVDKATIKEEVYIYGCRDVVIDIPTKAKAVRIDQCHNVTVLLTSALSGIEVVNSARMKIQVREKLPSVAIDKTDGIVVGLPWAARDALITTSKSSEMNVTFPVSDAEDADWIEQPIPEQFVTRIVGTTHKLATHVSELYSS